MQPRVSAHAASVMEWVCEGRRGGARRAVGKALPPVRDQLCPHDDLREWSGREITSTRSSLVASLPCLTSWRTPMRFARIPSVVTRKVALAVDLS